MTSNLFTINSALTEKRQQFYMQGIHKRDFKPGLDI